jgi:hypothetical protein
MEIGDLVKIGTMCKYGIVTEINGFDVWVESIDERGKKIKRLAIVEELTVVQPGSELQSPNIPASTSGHAVASVEQPAQPDADTIAACGQENQAAAESEPVA